MTFKKIRFVTDSTCDIPAETIAKYKIGVVPCYINFNNNSYADDGKEISRDDYYAQLPSIRPAATTAAMPPGVAEEFIMAAAEEADHVIVITVSSKLSGVYNAMKLGAGKLSADKFTMVDSESLSMGMGWQIIYGAETAEKTGDVQQVLDVMEKVRQKSMLFAGLQTLEYLHRSGRVSWAAAGIGALLQIKPIVGVTRGEVKNITRVRTFSKAVDELVRVAHEYAPLERLAILYTNDESGAKELKERLKDIAPADTIVCSITPTIGTHIGPGGLGIVPVSKI